jgi:polysaccharide export outer membrane protein
MDRQFRRPIACLLLLTTIFWLLPSPEALAQDAGASDAGGEEVYRIGSGDVLRLNVPQASNLDRELTVQTDGSVYVAPVGEVDLGGLTLEEAEQVLSRRLRLVDPVVQEVVLSVVEYNALRVFVLGAVNAPGSYTFDAPPSLWDVLRAAGGPAGEANLVTCRIITVTDGRPSSQTVNLSGYLTGDRFPPTVLQGGDTLVVPTVADGTIGVPPTEGVQVFGGVGVPTTVPVEEPTELLTVLMLAGAPIHEADLAKIDWVRRPGGGARDLATRVDMRDFLEQGRPAGNPLVYPGDVVRVHIAREGWFRRNVPLLLTTMTSVATLLLAWDRLQDR